jgi:hypothetical protein
MVAFDARLDHMQVGDPAVPETGGHIGKQGLRIAVMHFVEGVAGADPNPDPNDLVGAWGDFRFNIADWPVCLEVARCLMESTMRRTLKFSVIPAG